MRLVLAALLFGWAPLVFAGSTEAPAPARQEAAAELRLSKHARHRMSERGVDVETVRGVIASVDAFRYYHGGKWKTGYYDVQKKIFIASQEGVVITVITGATPSYVDRLRRSKR